MTLPDFLTRDPDGYIHVTGHRIGLQDLVYYYNEGFSAEGLIEIFPTLALPVVHKIIAFYLEGRATVDDYVAACETEIERQRLEAKRGPEMAELRRRLATRQTTGV